jgi:sucrose phosphorylase
MLQRLRLLYPDPVARSALPEIERILRVFYAHKPLDLFNREREFTPAERFTERDVILITYGDLLYKRHQSPLKTLGDFCDT